MKNQLLNTKVEDLSNKQKKEDNFRGVKVEINR